MKIKPDKQADYDKTLKVNDDPYGKACIDYAIRWADAMEVEIGEQTIPNAIEHTIKSCAERLSRETDTEGITGFMYGCAVSFISQTWIHGEILRRWHNLKTQIRDEGEKANENGGTLNPAIINLG